jgi:hypothetical protein
VNFVNATLRADGMEAMQQHDIPRLVFDSLWQPVRAGVRSRSGKPRRVTYRAAKITIEMQFEAVPNSELVNVMGQIFDNSRPGEDLTGIAVAIDGTQGKIAEVSTNQFGEFHLAFVPEGDLRISFAIRRGKEVSIPLEGATDRTSGSGRD